MLTVECLWWSMPFATATLFVPTWTERNNMDLKSQLAGGRPVGYLQA